MVVGGVAGIFLPVETSRRSLPSTDPVVSALKVSSSGQSKRTRQQRKAPKLSYVEDEGPTAEEDEPKADDQPLSPSRISTDLGITDGERESTRRAIASRNQKLSEGAGLEPIITEV